MNIHNTYIKFIDSEGRHWNVLISDILNGGRPIDPETGEDMDIYDGTLCSADGSPVI